MSNSRISIKISNIILVNPFKGVRGQIAQKQAIEKSLAAAKKKFNKPITTEIAALGKFYVAEESHQDYFRRNPNQPYCAYVISPKMQKLQKLQKELFPAKQP